MTLSAAMICGSARTCSSNSRRRARVVPPERGRDVHLQREPDGRRIEPGADDLDDAGLLQPANPVQRRGGRQADQAGQLDVRAVCVCLQLGQQLQINFIKFYGHVSKHYLVLQADQAEF